MKQTSVAVIGYGGMGGWHVDQLIEMPELSLAGIYDIDPERGRVAEEKGVHAYPSWEAVLADETVELVTIATPNHIHKDQVVQALRAGKHVICEKPVCLNGAELREMIQVAEETGNLFTVHQNRRWDEDFLSVKQVMEENLLGRVFCVESRVQGSRGIPGDWRNQKEYGGGMLLDWGVHLLDQAFLLNKTPLISVYAELTNVTNEAVDDGFKVLLTFEDGMRFHVEVGTSNFYALPRWYVLGENGSMVINDWDLSGKIVMVSDWEKRDAVPVVTAAGLTKTMAPRTDETIQEYPVPRVKSDVRDFYRNVCKAIAGQETQLVTHAQLTRVMTLMETIFASAAQNQLIPLTL